MAANDDRHRSLLSRRVPRAQIELGRAYVIHARNGGVGGLRWTKTALSVTDFTA
jgi:hypothetical protein